MKNIKLLLFIAFALAIIFQPGCVDNLKEDQAIKVDKLLKSADELDPKSEEYFELADSAYNLSLKSNYKEGISKSLYFLGAHSYQIAHYEEAFNYFELSISTQNLEQPAKLLGDCVNFLARTHYKLGRRDKAIELFKRAALIRDKINDLEGLGSSLNNTGFLYWQTAQYDSAIIYYQKALNVRQELPNKENTATTLNNLGTIYYQWSKYDKALQYYLSSLKLRKEINWGIGLVLGNIGKVYEDTDQPDLAIRYYHESLQYSFSGKDTQAVGYVYGLLGSVYTSINSNSALAYYEQSIKFSESVNYTGGVLLALEGIGKIYMNRGEYKKAEDYFLDILKMGRQNKILLRQTEALKYLGELYYMMGDIETAKGYCLKSIELGEQLNRRDLLKENYLILSKLLEAEGKIEKAYAAQKKYIEMRNEIKNAEMAKSLNELKRKFELEDYQTKLALQKFENEKQRMILTFSIAAILFLIFAVSGLYRMNLKRKKANKMLMDTNELIDRQRQELMDANEELKDLNKTKDKFYSIVAHDLKNPFMALNGYTSLLKDDYDNLTDSERKEYIENLQDVTTKTYRLLENLLELAASRSGKIEFSPDDFSLTKTVNSTIELILAQAQDKGIKLNRIEDEVLVRADERLVSTVIRNLLTNAVKFSKIGGEVTIKIDERDEHVEVSVKDNGIGMDDETQKNIFSIIDGNSQKGTIGEQGTGLGLGLCREFVEKNNGKIWVKSELGKGSEFIFTLPKLKQQN